MSGTGHNSWPLERIRYLFSERNEKGYPEEEQLAATQHAGVVPKSQLDFKTMEAVTSDLSVFKLVESGDFVISLRSFEGGIEYSDYRGIISPAYTVLRPSKAINSRFFHYFLKSEWFVQGLSRHKKGIRDGQSVPFATLQDDRLSVPPLGEQTRIANFLDEQTARIDALIAEKERLVERLDEYRQAWLSGLLESPHGSITTRLKFCLATSLQYGATESGDVDAIGPRYIRITDIGEGGSLSEDSVKFLTEEQASSYLLNDGDVLFARSGATVGKSFVYRSDMGRAAFAGYLIRARLDQRRLLPEYLALLTETHRYWAYLREEETQSTIQNASAEKYANFPIALPTVTEQRALLVRIRPMLDNIARLGFHTANHVAILREYRSSLISAAVTGQLDIDNYGKGG